MLGSAQVQVRTHKLHELPQKGKKDIPQKVDLGGLF